MNKSSNEIHILVQELLPMYEEVDVEAKVVIDEHLSVCEECRKNLTLSKEAVGHIEGENSNELQETKPFKKLNTLKKLICIFLVFSRAIILGIATYNFINNFNTAIPTGLQFEGLRATLMLFYLPFSVFSLYLIWLLKNRKTFVLALGFDLFVIIYMDRIIRYLLGV